LQYNLQSTFFSCKFSMLVLIQLLNIYHLFHFNYSMWNKWWCYWSFFFFSLFMTLLPMKKLNIWYSLPLKCAITVLAAFSYSSHFNHWPLPSPDGSNQMVCHGTKINILQVTMKVSDPMCTYCIHNDSGY
jgi:hypothetical protein